jgi:hypothetical protein
MKNGVMETLSGMEVWEGHRKRQILLFIPAPASPYCLKESHIFLLILSTGPLEFVTPVA